jgi:di/tricarboxylate transporter
MSEPVFTPEMGLVLAILFVAVLLFVTERVRIDVAALLIMVTLGLSGLVSGDQLFSGFSSNAVISIIAVMILGAGLDKSGAMNRLAGFILRAGGSGERRITSIVSSATGIMSGFMQNIGAAALFIPVVNRISADSGIPASRLIMPMGFAAILGGTLTLVGSGPLILLNDLMAASSGAIPGVALEPFGLFDVAPVGLALVAAGVSYFVLFGRRVLPDVRTAPPSADALRYLVETYGVHGDIFEATVRGDSSLVGVSVEALEADGRVFLIAAQDSDGVRISPPRDYTVQKGSILALVGKREEVEGFADSFKLADLKKGLDLFAGALSPSSAGIAEIVVRPNASVIGKRVCDVGPRRTYGVNLLALSRSGELIREDMREIVLRSGDMLVVYSPWTSLQRIAASQDFVVIGDYPREAGRPHKLPWALLFFGLSLALVIFTPIQLSLSLLLGAVGMIVAGVIRIDEAYQAVSWKTVFLLASLIPLGLAVEETGTAAWIAQGSLLLAGEIPIWGLQLSIAVLATFFSLVMSNVGATVLLVPLAINIAVAGGADPRVFALTVAIATSNAFIIPTHQVNALIMTPGGYSVKDFVRAGGIMTVLFLVVMMLVLNLLW